MKQIANFNINYADFDLNSSGHLQKQALCFAEGTWEDNQKRPHNFTVERLNRIANNTNSFFSSGNNIPLLKDHKKDVANTIGKVEGEWIVRPITEEDIQDERHKNLIGKMGLFTNNVFVTAKDACEKIVENGLKSISPGLDFVGDVIREISLTPMPAIPGMSLFNDALTWEELENSESDYEKLKELYDSYSDQFFTLVKNILENRNLENKDAYLVNAIEGFSVKLMEMLEINLQNEEEIYGQQYPQQPMPNYNQSMMQQQQMMSGNPSFSKQQNYVAAFSMADYYNKVYQQNN
jgi:hypothetical protein